MARKVNKSAEVRQYLTDHPESGPSEVAAALKRLNVSPNFVSNVKLKMKKGGDVGVRGRGRPKTSHASAGGGAAGYDAVVAAAQLIKSCGGVDEAKEALRVAEKVVSAAN